MTKAKKKVAPATTTPVPEVTPAPTTDAYFEENLALQDEIRVLKKKYEDACASNRSYKAANTKLTADLKLAHLALRQKQEEIETVKAANDQAASALMSAKEALKEAEVELTRLRATVETFNQLNWFKKAKFKF